MLSNPYFWGVVALAAMYVISWCVTRSYLPWSLARGNNKKLSTSQIQFVVFTVVTVFAYVTVFAARFIYSAEGEPLPPLSDLPLNLLILMGLSFTTMTASKAITISYLQKNEITGDDKSNLVANREGVTDLKKVQMLVWTLVAAAVYTFRIMAFVNNKEFASADVTTFPDIDGALLVLRKVADRESNNLAVSLRLKFSLLLSD